MNIIDSNSGKNRLKMNRIKLQDYDLNMTLLGGQSFAWDFIDGFYYGFVQDSIIKLKIENNFLYWQTYPQKDNYSLVKNYLRLNVPYLKIVKKISKDKHIKSAIKKHPGLRLLKQDFEETLFSFLVSTNNNIKSIRKIIRALNRKFGRKIIVDSHDFFLFPKAEAIANAKLEDLLSCKLGFRAKYLKGAAKHLLKVNLSSNIHNQSLIRDELLKINGVGEKITDCVLVFGLGFDDVTPLDVWAKRVFVNLYKLNPKIKYDDMRKWVSNYFEGYAGWAGQFLFEYARTIKLI